MNSLDMALDEIIEKNKKPSFTGRGRGRGRRGSRGRGSGSGSGRYFSNNTGENTAANGNIRVSSVLRVRRGPIHGSARPSSFQLSKVWDL